jgi:hypothetical protein
MSRKLSLDVLKLDMSKRGHTFISVSNTDNLNEGNLTAECQNNHVFTVSVSSYRRCRENKFGKKNGCPDCKANAFQHIRIPKRHQPKIIPKVFEEINSRES